MKNTIAVLVLLLSVKGFATEAPKASPSPVIPPPEIMKEKTAAPAGDKHHMTAQEKIEKFSDLCVANKKTCIRKLKEVRATLTDSKENRVLIQKIDAVLKKTK